mgnify:FL=1
MLRIVEVELSPTSGSVSLGSKPYFMVQNRDIRVTFQGVEYPGKHEPLVDSQTWQTVQAMLDSHRYGERQRIHNHFLKSTVVCGQCGARLSVQNAKNSKGTIYPYFWTARCFSDSACLCFRLSSLSPGTRVRLRSGRGIPGLSEGGHDCMSARSMRQYP